MTAKRPLRGYLSGVALSVSLGVSLGISLGTPAWGGDDTALHHSPLSGAGYPALQLGFNAFTWDKSSDSRPCSRPCISRLASNSRVAPDTAIYYRHDFKLNLGQAGPVSFGLSDRGLKMEVAF